MSNNVLIDIIGWMGVAGLLLAYAAVSSRRLAGDSTAYQLLNAVGSGLLIINSFYYGAYPSVGVNVAWIGIAVYTLARRRFGAGQGITG